MGKSNQIQIKSIHLRILIWFEKQNPIHCCFVLGNMNKKKQFYRNGGYFKDFIGFIFIIVDYNVLLSSFTVWLCKVRQIVRQKHVILVISKYSQASFSARPVDSCKAVENCLKLQIQCLFMQLVWCIYMKFS